MASAQNHLIELLPRPASLRLMARCETVELELSQPLCEPGTPARHAYFPTQGFISLVAASPSHAGLEVGMVGREGMLGAHVALGVPNAPLRELVQAQGQALRIGSAALRSELARSDALQRALNRYVYVLMTQLAAAATWLRFHCIGPRLARWLLMSQDRAGAERFRVTHEFLAYMPGVRHVGITAAAGGLQRSRLIEYSRGNLTVLDRARLEAAACGCYTADRLAYRELLD